MPVLRIRSVPEDIRQRLEERSALAGMSLPDFVLAELRRTLDRPTRQELIARVEASQVRHLPSSPTEIVRAERDLRSGD